MLHSTSQRHAGNAQRVKIPGAYQPCGADERQQFVGCGTHSRILFQFLGFCQ